MSLRPVFRVAVAGLDERDVRLIEIVFRHSQYNRYDFQLLPQPDPRHTDILIVNPATPSGLDALSALRAYSREVPAVSALPRGTQAAARHAITIDRLTLQLLPTLNRVVEIEGLEAGAEKGAGAGAETEKETETTTETEETGRDVTVPASLSDEADDEALIRGGPESAIDDRSDLYVPLIRRRPSADLDPAMESDLPGIPTVATRIALPQEPQPGQALDVVLAAADAIASVDPGPLPPAADQAACGPPPLRARVAEGHSEPAAGLEAARPPIGTASKTQASRTQASRSQASRSQASMDQASKGRASTAQASTFRPPMEPSSRGTPEIERAAGAGEAIGDRGATGLADLDEILRAVAELPPMPGPAPVRSPPPPTPAMTGTNGGSLPWADDAPRRSSHAYPVQILVADPSLAAQQQIARALRADGVGLQCVAGASAALQHAAYRQFDLVITEYSLADVSGFHLIRALRQRPGYRSTPVLLLRRRSGLLDAARACLLGDVLLLNKPLTRVELQAVVADALRRSLVLDDFETLYSDDLFDH